MKYRCAASAWDSGAGEDLPWQQNYLVARAAQTDKTLPQWHHVEYKNWARLMCMRRRSENRSCSSPSCLALELA
jgi:hypothetical protein